MKKILIISLTPVASEPRVIRQAEYLISKGFEIIVGGLPGKDKINENWMFVDLSESYKTDSQNSACLWQWFSLQKITRAVIYRLYKYASFIPRFAKRRYWHDPIYKKIQNQLEPHKAELIICHDYFTAPIAWNLGKKFGCNTMIDVHEHAISQKKTDSFLQNIKWFFIDRCYAHSIQKVYLPKMWKITTVCDSIAKDLQKIYKLKNDPITVRSIPFYSFQKLNHTNKNMIKILYHGLIAPGRGLEDCIKAMSFLPINFVLTIQGSGNQLYLNSLIHLVRKTELEGRVLFKDPVPFSEIVSKANQFDIGIFITKDIGLQKKYVLPNKLFEYVMAGLALCVSDLPEIAKVVKKYDLGVLASNNNPKVIAKTLEELTPDKISYYKQQSLKTAKKLNWEVESKKLGFIVSYLKKNYI